MEKTKEEIREEILQKLARQVGININEEGSIALAIVDVIVDDMHALYEQLDFISQQAYLSTSQGHYTDLIAASMNIEREDYETDDSLKLRTANSVYTHAGGNRIAIEEAARAVPGVASIEHRPYGSGTGSFVLYVYPTPGSNQARILRDVERALKEVVSDGIYYEVKQPEQKPIDVYMVVQFDENTSSLERQAVRERINYRVREYLNNLKRNEVLYINEIVSRAMGVSNEVRDVSLMELKVNGLSKSITNTFPANDEQFISGRLIIS